MGHRCQSGRCEFFTCNQTLLSRATGDWGEWRRTILTIMRIWDPTCCITSLSGPSVTPILRSSFVRPHSRSSASHYAFTKSMKQLKKKTRLGWSLWAKWRWNCEVLLPIVTPQRTYFQKQTFSSLACIVISFLNCILFKNWHLNTFLFTDRW